MNVLRLLMQQHDRIEGLLVDLTQASRQGGGERERALAEFGREMRRHFALEEALFYSALRGRLILVEAGRFLDEHRRLEALAADLESQVGGPQFEDTLESVHGLLVQHVSDEEIELFPEVKRRLSLDELDTMGEHFERALEGEPLPPVEEPATHPET